MSFTPSVGLGKLIVQKNSGYSIIQNKRATVDKGKQIMGSTNVVLEKRLDETTPKRQRIENEQAPQVEEYSPTQSPLHIEDEHLTRDQVEQLGSQGGDFITIVELEEGNP